MLRAEGAVTFFRRLRSMAGPQHPHDRDERLHYNVVYHRAWRFPRTSQSVCPPIVVASTVDSSLRRASAGRGPLPRDPPRQFVQNCGWPPMLPMLFSLVSPALQCLSSSLVSPRLPAPHRYEVIIEQIGRPGTITGSVVHLGWEIFVFVDCKERRRGRHVNGVRSGSANDSPARPPATQPCEDLARSVRFRDTRHPSRGRKPRWQQLPRWSRPSVVRRSRPGHPTH